MLQRFTQWLWGGTAAPPARQDAWTVAREEYLQTASTLASVCSAGPVGGQMPLVDERCSDLQRQMQEQWATLYGARTLTREGFAAEWHALHADMLRDLGRAVNAYRNVDAAVSYASVARSAVTAQPLPTCTYPPGVVTVRNEAPQYAVDLYLRKRGMPACTTHALTVSPVNASIVASAAPEDVSAAMTSVVRASGVSSVTTSTPVFLTPAAHIELCKLAQRHHTPGASTDGCTVQLTFVQASRHRTPAIQDAPLGGTAAACAGAAACHAVGAGHGGTAAS